MASIFPPSGPRDDGRWRSASPEDREYCMFCLEFCSGVLDRRPEHPEALEAAANHFTRLGYYADGLGLDERLVRLRPEDPDVLYNIACSLALVGRGEDALRALTRAVGRGYANRLHMAEDEDLASLRGDERFLALLARIHGKGE